MDKVMNNHKHSQQGVALITGLLMLLIMSLIGIATMESSMVQSSLASNTELKVMSYQEAEIELKRASDLQWMVAAMDDEKRKKELLDDDVNDGIYVKSKISYCGTLPNKNVLGLSLDANQAANSNSYTYYVFDITSDVELKAKGSASSQHSQRNSQLMMAASDAGNTCKLTDGI